MAAGPQEPEAVKETAAFFVRLVGRLGEIHRSGADEKKSMSPHPGTAISRRGRPECQASQASQAAITLFVTAFFWQKSPVASGAERLATRKPPLQGCRVTTVKGDVLVLSQPSAVPSPKEQQRLRVSGNRQRCPVSDGAKKSRMQRLFTGPFA
ncbi:hypothetical protein SKAU_G00008100 [Synaphobranchus kaupii]|uniref:Uncharacterized protein n=1 Tax=Synaphobranchus kaupii TaxID=118154 RepID=A0A9Q1G9M2_SYNKA|nr:hypothetical protein SKAU_G00008100 [Synaphobranchus kaupii]